LAVSRAETSDDESVALMVARKAAIRVASTAASTVDEWVEMMVAM